ncbi:MAG: glycosyltransferase [Anaerolineae bacterium]|nr:glycosyltransferase [Anaerolineae bacterium]
MNRRIAIFLPSLVGGGAERVMLNLAEGLANTPGYTVTLVLCAAAQSEPRYPVSSMINKLALNHRHVFASIPDLVRLLRREQYDVLLTALEHTTAAVYVAKILSGSISALFPTVHNTLSRTLRGSKCWQDRLLWYVSRAIYRRLHFLGAVSKGAAEDLHQQMGIAFDHIRVLPNPVLREGTSQGPLDYGLPKDALVAIGRLEHAKGFDVLIRAYAQLANEIEEPLVIFGEGSQREDLSGLICRLGLEGRVLMPGYLPNAAACLTQAKLFILSSRVEGLPTVLIEALAAGAPIVAADCPSGPREILDNGRYGVLVPPEDAAALAEGMRQQMATGRPVIPNQQYVEQYSIKNGLSLYIQVFDELLSETKDHG